MDLIQAYNQLHTNVIGVACAKAVMRILVPSILLLVL